MAKLVRLLRFVRFVVIGVLVASLLATEVRAEEVTLYTGYGEPVAYINPDDEMTIYTWDGHAVAYLVRDWAPGASWYVYGWNGSHLGWFERGVMWNTRGYAQCALREALAVGVYAETAKYAKYPKNARYAPYAKPGYFNSFDRIPCADFLKAGAP